MSDSDDDTGFPPDFKPTYVLIAIDTGPLMFCKNENGSTPFKDSINACYDLTNSLMFTQNKRSWSPFGVMLANDASESLVNFNDNVLKSVKFLKGKKELSLDDLESLYQRKGGVDLSMLFLSCTKKFKQVNSVFYKRIIVFITNDDNPTVGDKNQRFTALNEAKNFESSGITFELVTMNPNFDYKLFYNELFSVMKAPLVETLVEDEEGLQEKLSSLIITRIYQRKLKFFPFQDDENRFLKVRQKSFIREEKFYTNAFVSSSGEPLKKIMRKRTTIVGKIPLKHNIEPLEFELEEYMEIVSNHLPTGYTLLYVSDRMTEVGSVLIDTLLLEKDHDEDLPYFDSFWQYCADNNKVLICVRKLRQNDKLRVVEFIPKFANNTKFFMIKGIPFIKENKYPPTKLAVGTQPSYSQEKLKVANALIDTLSFDYHPKMFKDPVNERKKAFLRAKLLDEPKEDVEDVTLDNQGIDRSLGEIGESFKKLFSLDEEEKGAKKRKPAAGRAATLKRKK